MKHDWMQEWQSMTIDELFAIRQMMHDVLIERMKARKGEVVKRLRTLNIPYGN